MTPLVDTFFAHCIEVEPSGCWRWTRALTGGGYGNVVIAGRIWPAHRAVYVAVHGPVDRSLDLDHLCRNRACVNPDHLEPVTRRENLLRGETLAAANARKTHCPKGHPYDEQNTIVRVYGTPRRYCRTCIEERNARRSAAPVASGAA